MMTETVADGDMCFTILTGTREFKPPVYTMKLVGDELIYASSYVTLTIPAQDFHSLPYHIKRLLPAEDWLSDKLYPKREKPSFMRWLFGR